MGNSSKKVGAIYSRVSDDESASKQHGSLEQQTHMGREKAEALTRATGIDHVIEYVLVEKDGVSGSHTNRPQYQRLLDLIAARRIDFIVAKEISRLNRSTKDFCELMDRCKKNGVAVYIQGLDMDPNHPFGQMVYTLLATIAELERNLIVSRTRSSILSRMKNNAKIHGGRVLLGFDKHPTETGVWVPNLKGLKKVDRLLELVVLHDSYRSICEALDREGIYNTNGSPFRADAVKRAVFSKRYEGILEFQDGEKVIQRDLGFGCVVDPSKLAAARARLLEFQTRFNGKTKVRKRTYLLSGLLAHSDGSTFHGRLGNSKTGEKYFYYWCKKKKISISADDLEKEVVRAIACYKNEQEIQKYTSEAVAQLSTSLDMVQDQIETMRKRLGELKQKEGKLLDAFLAGKGGSAIEWLEGQLKNFKGECESLETKIHALEREKSFVEKHLPNPKNMQKTLEYVFLNFADAEPSVRRSFLRQVFDRIEVTDDNQVKLFWRFPEIKNPPPNPDRGSGGNGFAYQVKWGDRRGSNPRHLESQSNALPTELRPPQIESPGVSHGESGCQ